MAPGRILQIFLRLSVQNQIRVAQRVVVDKIIRFRPLCAAALFKPSYPLLQLKGTGHVKQKRQLSKAVFFVVQECNPNPNHFPLKQLLPLPQM